MLEKSKNKILVIGVDGGTFDVILPLVQDDKLPNLGALMHKGTYGKLMSTVPPVTAPAWSSFITGSNPGRHGVFQFFRSDTSKYNLRDSKTLINLRHISGIPFWRVLNRHGYKVGLINIPLTYPPDKVDRFMISGMLVPQGAEDYVYPHELFSQLDDYKVDLDGLMVKKEWQGKKLVKKNREKFVQNVFNLTRTRAHCALTLMKEKQWDLFMVVFTGSDRICHFLWEDRNSGKSPSSSVQDYYIFLDSMIGMLVDEAGEDTIKLVMSDHGFGRAPTKKINAFVLMKQLKHTAFVPRIRSSYVRNRLLGRIGIKKKIFLENFLDFKRSKIFFVPLFANFLGICINTKNEKKWGIVPSGEEYESLRQQIIQELQDLVDPISGGKMVAQIHTREVVYPGPYMNQAPDIVVQFADDYKVGFSPLRRALVRKDSNPIRTGEHRREGFFLACGPHIRTGSLGREVFIQDVTPTLLYLLDTPIPKAYDGKLIKELFSSEYLAQCPPEYEEPDGQLRLEANGTNDLSQSELEELREFLENLGYL